MQSHLPYTDRFGKTSYTAVLEAVDIMDYGSDDNHRLVYSPTRGEMEIWIGNLMPISSSEYHYTIRKKNKIFNPFNV